MRPEIGRIYQVADRDYKFGSGPLLVRVSQIISECDFGTGDVVEIWWDVEATVKVPNRAGVAYPRRLYLRDVAVRQ
ncbi:hypothetical protein [Actinoplanes sp. NPDC051859]|uniref:hypothetical protein n=1 Tax=Actinoplanes sp. NPDC051859 TaxID=3363909 RepID=UPI0037BA5C98